MVSIRPPKSASEFFKRIIRLLFALLATKGFWSAHHKCHFFTNDKDARNLVVSMLHATNAVMTEVTFEPLFKDATVLGSPFSTTGRPNVDAEARKALGFCGINMGKLALPLRAACNVTKVYTNTSLSARFGARGLLARSIERLGQRQLRQLQRGTGVPATLDFSRLFAGVEVNGGTLTCISDVLYVDVIMEFLLLVNTPFMAGVESALLLMHSVPGHLETTTAATANTALRRAGLTASPNRRLAEIRPVAPAAAPQPKLHVLAAVEPGPDGAATVAFAVCAGDGSTYRGSLALGKYGAPHETTRRCAVNRFVAELLSEDTPFASLAAVACNAEVTIYTDSSSGPESLPLTGLPKCPRRLLTRPDQHSHARLLALNNQRAKSALEQGTGTGRVVIRGLFSLDQDDDAYEGLRDLMEEISETAKSTIPPTASIPADCNPPGGLPVVLTDGYGNTVCGPPKPLIFERLRDSRTQLTLSRSNADSLRRQGARRWAKVCQSLFNDGHSADVTKAVANLGNRHHWGLFTQRMLRDECVGTAAFVQGLARAGPSASGIACMGCGEVSKTAGSLRHIAPQDNGALSGCPPLLPDAGDARRVLGIAALGTGVRNWTIPRSTSHQDCTQAAELIAAALPKSAVESGTLFRSSPAAPVAVKLRQPGATKTWHVDAIALIGLIALTAERTLQGSTCHHDAHPLWANNLLQPPLTQAAFPDTGECLDCLRTRLRNSSDAALLPFRHAVHNAVEDAAWDKEDDAWLPPEPLLQWLATHLAGSTPGDRLHWLGTRSPLLAAANGAPSLLTNIDGPPARTQGSRPHTPLAATPKPDLDVICSRAPGDATLFTCCTAGTDSGDNMLRTVLALATAKQRTILVLASFPSSRKMRSWVNASTATRTMLEFPEGGLPKTTPRSLTKTRATVRGSGDMKGATALIAVAPAPEARAKRARGGGRTVAFPARFRPTEEALRALGPVLLGSVEGGGMDMEWRTPVAVGVSAGAGVHLDPTFNPERYRAKLNSPRHTAFMRKLESVPGDLALLFCGSPQTSLRDALVEFTGLSKESHLLRAGTEIAGATTASFFYGACATHARRIDKGIRSRNMRHPPTHPKASGCLFYHANARTQPAERRRPAICGRCPGDVASIAIPPKGAGTFPCQAAALVKPPRLANSPPCLGCPEDATWQCRVCHCCRNCAAIPGIGCSGGGHGEARAALMALDAEHEAALDAAEPPAAAAAASAGPLLPKSTRHHRFHECQFELAGALVPHDGPPAGKWRKRRNGAIWTCRLSCTAESPHRCPHHAAVEAGHIPSIALPPPRLDTLNVCTHTRRTPREGAGCYRKREECVCFNENREYVRQQSMNGVFALTALRKTTAPEPCWRCGSKDARAVTLAPELLALGPAFDTKVRPDEAEVTYCSCLVAAEQAVYQVMRDHWSPGITQFIAATDRTEAHKLGNLPGERICADVLDRAKRCRKGDPWGQLLIDAASTSVERAVAHLISRLPSYVLPEVAAAAAAAAKSKPKRRGGAAAGAAPAAAVAEVDLLAGDAVLQRRRVAAVHTTGQIGQLGATAAGDTFLVLRVEGDADVDDPADAQFAVRWIRPGGKPDELLPRETVLNGASLFAERHGHHGDASLTPAQLQCVRRFRLRMRGDDVADPLQDGDLFRSPAAAAGHADGRGARQPAAAAAAAPSAAQAKRWNTMLVRTLAKSRPLSRPDDELVRRLEENLGVESSLQPLPARKDAVLLSRHGRDVVGVLSSPTPPHQPTRWRVHSPEFPNGYPTADAIVRECRDRWRRALATSAARAKEVRALHTQALIAARGSLDDSPAPELPNTWVRKGQMEVAAKAAAAAATAAADTAR